MNNKQQHKVNEDTIEEMAEKLLTNIEDPTRLNDEGKNIIKRIAELSLTEDFDEKTQFAIISKKIQRVELRKRAILFYGSIISGVAAVVLISIFTISWINNTRSFSLQNEFSENNNAVNKEEGVKLTLKDGSTIDLTEKEKTSISIDDSIFIESIITDGDTRIQKELKYNSLEVPKTKEFTLLLVDGTKIKINSDSKIKFPDQFSDIERRVVLETGEAFFDVAHNDKKPFIVEVNNSEISVIGTTFNVNAYTEHSIKTTLVEGKVKIRATTSSKEITLKPGQQAALKHGDIKVSTVDVNPYIAWTKGLFIFNNLDLKSIMDQINRWYNINATFEDPSVESYTFTGVFKKQYSKEQIFRLIEQTTQINIETKNENDVIISKKANTH